MTRRRAHAHRFPIREDRRHRLEVHVAGYCFRATGGGPQLLVAQRTLKRELYPGLWECGGGHVKPGENFEEALRRQYYEELGIKVRLLGLFVTYEILRPRGPKIPGLKYLCLYDNGPTAIELDPREFMQFRWVSEREARRLKMIGGMRADLRDAFATIRSVFRQSRATTGTAHIGFRPPAHNPAE